MRKLIYNLLLPLVGWLVAVDIEEKGSVQMVLAFLVHKYRDIGSCGSLFYWYTMIIYERERERGVLEGVGVGGKG